MYFKYSPDTKGTNGREKDKSSIYVQNGSIVQPDSLRDWELELSQ